MSKPCKTMSVAHLTELCWIYKVLGGRSVADWTKVCQECKITGMFNADRQVLVKIINLIMLYHTGGIVNV